MKLASLVLVLGSLLLADVACAQEAVYAAPVAAEPRGPAAHDSRNIIKDSSAHARPMTASALAYIPILRGVGIGIKGAFEIPIVPDGFLPRVNDSFSLEPSLSIAYTRRYSYGFGIGNDHDWHVNTAQFTPAISGLWSFYFKPDLRVYGALNLGVVVDKYNHGLGSDAWAYVEVAGGVFYTIAEKIALRAEFGWYGLRGGVSFFL